MGAGVVLVFGSFVVLFGEDCSDGVDDGLVVGEDSRGVGASAVFAVEAFVGVVGPDLGPDIVGEGSEGEGVCSGLVEVFKDGGEFVLDVV